MKKKKEKAKKIAVLPIDNRPCSYDFIKMLGDYTDYKLELPPKTLLGKFLKTGNPDRLESWLRKQSKKCEAVVVSVDALLFGNLVSSRISTKSFTKVMKRLNFLRKAAKQKKGDNVYIFNILTRLMPTTKNKKEAQFNQKLEEFLTVVYNKIKFKKVIFKENWWDIYKLEDEAKKYGIPWNKVKEYLKIRLRNHKINLLMFDWSKEGLFEYMILCLDDTKTMSLNSIERDILRKKMKALNLKDRVSMYPGTDESIQLVLARFLIKMKDVRPKIYIDFFPSYGSRIIPIYEDASIKEIIADQISAIGALQVAIPDQADIILMINAPVNQQYEAGEQDGKNFAKNRLFIYKEFLLKLNQYFEQNKLVAVADVAYANGADIGLAEVLRKNVDVMSLAAYSAWNTAGNAMGTALVQSVLYFLYPESRKSKAHYKFLMNRFLDDWLYQSIVRPHISKKLQAKKIDIHDLKNKHALAQQMVAKSMKKVSQQLFGETFKKHPEMAKITLKNAKLPWPRIFEVDLDIDIKLTSPGKSKK
ncbi:MAG: DUF4127 family protein [Armatimonadota bacterium]